eukprot:CCRYP_006388-RA/>CCRYP_006388-RA protein AED:0.08 eAED:0.08 QI:3191/1/1/1/0.5/0.33/3/246/591
MTMIKSLILLSAPLLVVSEQLRGEPTNFDSVSEGLVFESVPEPQFDRRRILAEIHGGHVPDLYYHDVPHGEEQDERPYVPMVFDGEEEGTAASEAEGEESVDVPIVRYAPVARKLRRVTAPVNKAKKESLRDVDAPLLQPVTPQDRVLQECATGEKYFKIDLTTDNYGFENRWTLKTTDGDLVQKGPLDNTNYADNTRYLGGFCVAPGSYVFTVYDKFKDGMCCGTGAGSYAVELDGVPMFASPSGDEDWETREHFFTIEGSGDDRSAEDEESEPEGWDWDADYEDTGDYDEDFDEFDDLGGLSQTRASSFGGCQALKVSFKVDKHGRETSVYVKKSGSSKSVLSSVKQVGAYQTKTLSKCVPPGTYTVTFKDPDGLCCRGGQGWFKISVRGTQLASGGYFVGSKSFTVKVGHNYQRGMSARDKQYLAAHNSRRRKWHRNAGKSYKALRWSSTLASAASGYARKLLGSCASAGIVHAKGVEDGENLAKNKGTGQWGKLYPVNNIVTRWVEREAKWSYPKNAHLTQAIWRATSYLGCGESVKKMSNGDTCRIQVCRYTRAGNCNVRNGNWRSEAFKDDTACGRPCPSEGCYA